MKRGGGKAKRKTRARKAARRKTGGSARSRKRAARKKTRAKAPRRKAAARKKVARKKAPRRAATRKKATRGKASGRSAMRKGSAATAKRKTVAAAPRKPPVNMVAERPSGSGSFQVQPAQPLEPAAAEEESPEDVGSVVHFYPHVNAAIVRVLGGGFRVGDTLQFKGHTTDFQQRVGHIELEHEAVEITVRGQIVGIQVNERVREHDRVRKVANE